MLHHVMRLYLIPVFACLLQCCISRPAGSHLIPPDYWPKIQGADVINEAPDTSRHLSNDLRGGYDAEGQMDNLDDAIGALDLGFNSEYGEFNNQMEASVKSKIVKCVRMEMLRSDDQDVACKEFFHCINSLTGSNDPVFAESVTKAVMPNCEFDKANIMAKRAPYAGAIPRYEFLGNLMARVAKKPKRSEAEDFRQYLNSGVNQKRSMLVRQVFRRKREESNVKSPPGLRKSLWGRYKMMKRTPESIGDGGASVYPLNDGTVGDFANGLAIDAFASMMREQRRSHGVLDSDVKPRKHIRPFIG